MDPKSQSIASDSDVDSFLGGGQSAPASDVADPGEVDQFLKEDKYGSLGQQLITGLEGAASAATFGLSTGLELAKGVKAEDIRARREVNPGSHTAGQVAGIVGTALIPGAGEVGAAGLLGKAGNLGARIVPEAMQATTLGKIGAAAARAGVENALFQAGDEVSKMLTSDPHQSVETALSNVGLAGLFGAGVGGTLGAVPPLWKSTIGERGGKFIEDFKGRINQHLNNPEPLGAVQEQMGNYYRQIKDMADEVYGAQGLKAQEIKKLTPELNEKIIDQSSQMIAKLEEAALKLGDDPLAHKLNTKATEFKNAINSANTSHEIFDAMQNMKQQLQEWGKYNKNFVPLAEKEFRDVAKGVGFEFRNALEDPAVWGKAADRQQSINKAFKEFLPTLQDFEKKFTVEVGGERVIDPGKINTYMNQLGRPNAEIKQTMLKNFLDKAESYKDVIAKTHENLGIENPMPPSALHAVEETLKEIPRGAKLADALVKKGMANLSGEVIGAGVGGAVGGAAGSPGIGAIIGQHALGPFFSSILPSIAKPLLEMQANAAALKSGVEYGLQVIKGENLIKAGTRAIYKSSREVLPSKNIDVSQGDRERLERRISQAEANPESLLSMGGDSGYYMPGHTVAMAETAGRVSNFLKSIKPLNEKKSPLDHEMPLSQAQKSAYNRALDIADKPLIVLQRIKDNTLIPQDVAAIKSMYPSLYNKLAQNLTDGMIEHISKDEPISYGTKQSLSLFLGQPLDSVLTPANIQAAQMTFAKANPQPQGGAPKKGTSKLNKIADNYLTPSQASQKRKLQS